jgi:hypothetical protein
MREFFVYLHPKNLKSSMNTTEQTLKQIGRAIRKITEKFPESQEASLLTDIHLCVSQETGELIAFDDDDKEITRCVVEQWIDDKDDDFFKHVANLLRKILKENASLIENMSILKPYAFVLENKDEREEEYELYVVDGDTVIIDPIIMEDLDKDLDNFFEQLMKDI